MHIQNLKMSNLSEMVRKAKEFHMKKWVRGEPLPSSETLANDICEGIKKHQINAVTIPQWLANGSCPEIATILTRIKEENVKVFVEII